MAGEQTGPRAFNGFKVLCAWCGDLIRRDGARDSLGMCLNCYHKELKACLSARQQKQQTASPVASER